jgi:hypothetical protein
VTVLSFVIVGLTATVAMSHPVLTVELAVPPPDALRLFWVVPVPNIPASEIVKDPVG